MDFGCISIKLGLETLDPLKLKKSWMYEVGRIYKSHDCVHQSI